MQATKYLFYGISALLLTYAIWSYSRGTEIIAEALQIGQITVAANLYDIISFHMANSGQYFIFAAILAGIGVIIGKKPPQPPPPLATAEDEPHDEWFNAENENEEQQEPNKSHKTAKNKEEF
ncbi:MAG: hypothetical protein FWG68_05765 [Defluviitaleaceae bacterium]|nr:hypothetical protein [Defluviitaleaceae bacterium]